MYLNNGSTIYEHHNLFEKLQHINIENIKPIQVAFALFQIQRQKNPQNEQEFGDYTIKFEYGNVPRIY
jgi:hypothetical protein